MNKSVPGGTTLHWHGLDVPNGMDGVAGVTQDAVQDGVAPTPNDSLPTRSEPYWYHSHRNFP